MSLALRVRGAAQSRVTDRLRAIATALDPTLRLGPILTLDEVLREDQGTMRLLALAIALATLSVLLLSAAGIYALMSFTVARRRREIGIRAALGAHPRRLLASIFSGRWASSPSESSWGSWQRPCSTGPPGVSCWAERVPSSCPVSRR